MKKKLILLALVLFMATIFISCESTKVAQFTEDGTPIINIKGIITDISVDGKSYFVDNKTWVTITSKTTYGKVADKPLVEQFIEPTFRVGNSLEAFSAKPNASNVKLQAVYTNWNWDAPIIVICEPLFEPAAEMID